ncbi:WbqC family protein [Streptomyces sp. NPDC056121]|uniref:WbqC family protein n=1 Tax=unclassified Streptomyces TaxID=2593676 RepID=UPI0035D7AE1A
MRAIQPLRLVIFRRAAPSVCRRGPAAVIVTCVTSRYLPNLRHIARLCEVDIAVVLDLAPLPHRNRDSFVTRNRIHQDVTKEGHWLTVPVVRRRRTQQVREAEINPTDHRWARKHILTLRQAYPQAESLAPGFLGALGDAIMADTVSLLEVNNRALEVILETLGCRHKMPVLESAITSNHRKEHRSDIASALGADRYLAGEVERESIAAVRLEQSFTDAGIVLQDAGPFQPELYRDAVRYSAVHVICGRGVVAAQTVLDRLLSE